MATAALDGHTLLMAISPFTMTPAIYKEMPFDAVADFALVSMSQKMPNSSRVKMDSGSHDFREVLKEHGITSSICRKANCWDNACSEARCSGH